MKKIWLVSLVILSSYSLTFAQTDEAYKKALAKMFRASHSDQTFEAAIKQMFSMFREQMEEVPSEIWDDLENELGKTSINDLVEMLIPVYKKHLTIEDLNGLINFYESPAGRKYAEENPAIVQESMAVGQEWGKKIGADLAEKLKEKGYK